MTATNARHKWLPAYAGYRCLNAAVLLKQNCNSTSPCVIYPQTHHDTHRGLPIAAAQSTTVSGREPVL